MNPEDPFPDEKDYFNAFIRAAQYITHLTPRQDILTETGNALVRFYGARLVGFFEVQSGEITGHHWVLPEGISSDALLTDEIKKIVSGVINSGFLETRHLDLQGRYTAAFLPITWENQTTAVMLVGHRNSRPAPDDLLNTYLAIAGLVSTAISTSVAAFENIAERKRAEEALVRSEERYRTLFTTMLEGFCIIEMVFDNCGKPVDYRFLEINPAFENQTGLHDAKGKLMRDLAPDHEAHWFEMYGKIALTGEPARFVNEARALNRWYDVSAVRLGGPESRRVAILFNDITDRVRAEEELKCRHDDLNAAYEELTATQEELRQTNDELVRNEHALMDKNEDLVATNEELRAAQEELTRNEQALIHQNEELGALNEELTATQEELQQNVEELTNREILPKRSPRREGSPALRDPPPGQEQPDRVHLAPQPRRIVRRLSCGTGTEKRSPEPGPEHGTHPRDPVQDPQVCRGGHGGVPVYARRTGCKHLPFPEINQDNHRCGEYFA